jgi:hypothetical protein
MTNKLRSLVTAGILGVAVAGCEKPIPNPNNFHQVGRLSNGRFYGQLGAVRYLLSESGDPVSKGFHEITPVDENYDGNENYIGNYTAKLGSCDFKIDAAGQIIKASSEGCRNAPRDYSTSERLERLVRGKQ